MFETHVKYLRFVVVAMTRRTDAFAYARYLGYSIEAGGSHAYS